MRFELTGVYGSAGVLACEVRQRLAARRGSRRRDAAQLAGEDACATTDPATGLQAVSSHLKAAQELRRFSQKVVGHFSKNAQSVVYGRGQTVETRILLAGAGPRQSLFPLIGSSYIPSLHGQRFFKFRCERP